MSICVLAERYGVKGQTLRKQYKEKISDYRNWDQLEHAHDYLLYPENIGEKPEEDVTGDVATIAPGVTIGDRAVIGPKAMVYNDVEEGQEQC